jgi:hypothetical protein
MMGFGGWWLWGIDDGGKGRRGQLQKARKERKKSRAPYLYPGIRPTGRSDEAASKIPAFNALT